ncbi:MAG: glycoside hydrolase family 2 TIM barrel-domain containing protein [bacterium]|nr:glycoside hydrolase family 2 TIM barrel-domain containing protein [bacterium]
MFDLHASIVLCGVLVSSLLPTVAARQMEVVCTNALTTSWGRSVTPENAWREYPRPQLVRTNWTSLNGQWDYAVTSVTVDEPKAWEGKIVVPYPIESPLSGVRRRVTPEEQIWYRRTFSARPRPGHRTILNFERVDFRASVFVNGVEAMDVPHEGGNVPFSCDVTDLLKPGENELKVLVWDPTDAHIGGTGKQVLELWTCFFGASSGIVGGVWLEEVPETYLADYWVKTDVDSGTVAIEPEVRGRIRDAEVRVEVFFKNKSQAVATIPAGESATLKLPAPVRLWSCDEPNLYDFDLKVLADGQEDRVRGYFGMRKVETKLDAKGIRRVAVNGAFTYLLATLDQGWWPDGLLTPPSESACRFDVDFHKKAGFNAIRKHIKIEPRAFYAHCDRIGVMVLQDVPSFGADRRQGDLSHSNVRYGFFRRELKDCVDHLRNHPSIVMWIPFNEGWGQPSADKTRHANKWLRRYDPSRLINGPSGWNDYEGGFVQPYTKWAYADVADETVYTDCIDLHHYPDARMHPANGRRVSFLGEFGGMGVSLEGHVQDPKGKPRRLRPVADPNWRREQQARYADLMKPLPDLIRAGLGGSVYTEAIDQFWELGGFVTFDREIVKLDYAFLRGIHQEVLDAAREAATTPPPTPVSGPLVVWETSPALDRGEWPRLKVLDDGRYVFSYSRTPREGAAVFDCVVRYSSDKGRNWTSAQMVIPHFERPDGRGGTMAYSICNPELTQLPADHPTHPNRLIVAANLRPKKGTPKCPSSVGFTVSDDNGRTWNAVKPLLPVAGDSAVKGGRSCWEAFVQALPDGALHLFYSDIVPNGGRRSERTVSRFVSLDGGDTWKGPEVVLLRPGSWAGVPSSIVFEDRLYLAHEERVEGGAHPVISMMKGAAVPLSFEPFAASLAKNVTGGAPYLIQTERYFVLSAQVAEVVSGKDSLARTQMHVWVMPKNQVGATGELNSFVRVENPLGAASPMYWNGLAPLGGDEIMATCQRGADLFLVRGRIESR